MAFCVCVKRLLLLWINSRQQRDSRLIWGRYIRTFAFVEFLNLGSVVSQLVGFSFVSIKLEAPGVCWRRDRLLLSCVTVVSDSCIKPSRRARITMTMKSQEVVTLLVWFMTVITHKRLILFHRINSDDESLQATLHGAGGSEGSTTRLLAEHIACRYRTVQIFTWHFHQTVVLPHETSWSGVRVKWREGCGGAVTCCSMPDVVSQRWSWIILGSLVLVCIRTNHINKWFYTFLNKKKVLNTLKNNLHTRTMRVSRVVVKTLQLLSQTSRSVQLMLERYLLSSFAITRTWKTFYQHKTSEVENVQLQVSPQTLPHESLLTWNESHSPERRRTYSRCSWDGYSGKWTSAGLLHVDEL